MKVTLHHLTADAAAVRVEPRDLVLDEVTPGQFGALLERFRLVDAAQNHEHDPHVGVQTPGGKFLIRTSAGKLHLYDARDTTQAATELELAALVDLLTGSRSAPRFTAPEEAPLDLPPPNRTKQTIGTVLLAVGAVLNAWAVYAFFQAPPADPVPISQPVTDVAEISRLRDPLLGTYATGSGSTPGDRLIVLGPGDTVQLQVLDANHAIRGETVTGRLVRQEGRPAIALPGAGFIQLQADDTLRYFGDTYRLVARK